MSIIEEKQTQAIWKSRTVVISIVAILSIFLVIGLMLRFPDLKPYSSVIFTMVFSTFGALIAKYLFTDGISMIGEIVYKVLADGKIDEKDISMIIQELLTDDNQLDAQTVAIIEKKFVEKKLLSKQLLLEGVG